MTDQTLKRITIDAPSEAVILAARHLDATEGRVQVGSTVDTSTRSAITRVLDYIARAHNMRAAIPTRDEVSRYDRLSPIARALVDDYNELDLAEMLVAAQDELAALRAVAALDQPAPAATEIGSSPLRDRIAAALYERERPPRDPHWPDAYAMDREVFEAMADAVLPVVQPELDALAPAAAEADPFSYEERERTGRNAGLVFPAATEAAAWTPPPPGDRREQLPDHLLALINAPDYLSTACEAAILLAWQMPKHTHRRVELGEHSDRLHSRCRLQNKSTGVACRCDCHATQKEN